MYERQSNFWPALAGMAIGAIGGAAAMFFLSPRSGRANRRLLARKMEEWGDYLESESEAIAERVYDIFGEVNESTTALFNDARRAWEIQIRKFERTLDKLDKKTYQDMVDDVMESLQIGKRYAEDDLSKMKRYLNSQWRKLAASME
ncbi:YtxH domain-containing protein [bacterium]|nr:YtxH domain-containing protein [bacterium]